MIDEILENFKNSELCKKPFWYKHIKNIFPISYYKELIENLPNISEYTAINKTGAVSSDYSSERFVFDLTNENIDKLEINKRDTFKKLVGVFTNPKFFNVISSEFKDTINDRIKNFSEYEKKNFGVNNFQFSGHMSLVKDFKKYKLGVHTDTSKKFLTFLFYIPENNDLEELGTALYEKDEKADIDFGIENNKHIDEKYFKLIKKIPFLPNTLLVFPRTNNTYHGVQKINIEGVERNLIQLNYYFKNII